MARIAWIVVVMVILRINASIYIHHLIFGDQPSVRFAWWIMNGQALRARQPSELLGLPRHYVLHRIAEWLDLADDRVKDLKKLIHGCSFVQNQISSSEKGARRHSFHVWTRTQNKVWPRRPCFSFIQNFSVLKLLSKIAWREKTISHLNQLNSAAFVQVPAEHSISHVIKLSQSFSWMCNIVCVLCKFRLTSFYSRARLHGQNGIWILLPRSSGNLLGDGILKTLH